MAIDTIFLCFCEDCEQNDGISKPYYMSRGLMVRTLGLINKLKKLLLMHSVIWHCFLFSGICRK